MWKNKVLQGIGVTKHQNFKYKHEQKTFYCKSIVHSLVEFTSYTRRPEFSQTPSNS